MVDRLDPSVRKVILFTGDTWEHVCPVVRVVNPAHLAGMDVIPGNEWINLKMVIHPERIQQADLVILQRDFPYHYTAYETVMTQARQHGKPVIYELDDLLLELPEDHYGSTRYLQTRLAMIRALVDADAVTASTQPLGEYLKRYNPNVHILPNYLDEQLWHNILRPANNLPKYSSAMYQADKNPVVIGYLGSPGHINDLQVIFPALVNLLRRYGSRLKFRFWGFVPPPPFHESPNVEWTQVGMVSYQQFAEYFQEQHCDIFIAPLRDNIFNQCKSSIKFLEYSALGIPGVYSRLAPYELVVQDSINGFLATSPEEWEERLTQLIEDESLRARMGSASQETIVRDWLLSNHAQEWQNTYNQIYQSYQKDFSTRKYQMYSSAASISDILRLAVEWQSDLAGRLNYQTETNRQLIQRLGDMNIELTGKEQAFQTANSLYLEIMNSSSWKFMRRIIRLRLKLIPKNSRREKMIRLLFFSFQVLRREGIKAFFKGTKRRVSAALRKDSSSSAASEFQLSTKNAGIKIIAEGTKIPLPAITIVSILNAANPTRKYPSVDPGLPDQDGGTLPLSLSAWIEQQTLGTSFIEEAFWDRAEMTAWLHHGETSIVKPEEKWEARNFAQVAKGLNGRYICIASRDLVMQNSTYLEENLVALESESLAFTLNVNGHATWAFERIASGCLPGDSPNLLRLIISSQCIQASDNFVDHEETFFENSFSSEVLFSAQRLDFSKWFEGRPEIYNVVGRIITHTTRAVDQPEVLPFENHLPDLDWHIFNNSEVLFRNGIHPNVHLNARPQFGSTILQEPSQPASILHPLGSILPIHPVPSDLPTVLLVQQYLAVGGAEQLALHIMQGLRDQVRFVVVSTDPMDPSLGTLADVFREITPYVYSLPDFLERELTLSFFEYLIERFTPTTLYIANGSAIVYDILGSIKKKYPLLRTVNQVYDSLVGWINRYDLDLITYLDAHIGANEHICQAYLEKGAHPGTVYQVAHAIDLSRLNPGDYSEIRKTEIRLRLGLSPSGSSSPQTRCVTFASRLNPQKRPVDFIELARRFSGDPSVEFLMVGDGPLSKSVDHQINRIGLQNIRRHPFYRPISDILAITDVLVLPSEYEGMPLIVSEAMAMGKPVVVTDVGNNRQVIDLTGGGVLVAQIGDITGLENGVRQMLSAPPDGQKIRQAIQQNFGVDVIAAKYLKVLLGTDEVLLGGGNGF